GAGLRVWPVGPRPAQAAPAAHRLPQFDLRLMSWGDGTGVPTSGNNLIIVGTDNNNLLHIRIFDHDGHRVADTDETKLSPAPAQRDLGLEAATSGLVPPP